MTYIWAIVAARVVCAGICRGREHYAGRRGNAEEGEKLLHGRVSASVEVSEELAHTLRRAETFRTA